jgi:hypothetical protein
MESATPQDVQQALMMTPESMIQYYMQIFKALVTLIELARRPSYDNDNDVGSGDVGETQRYGGACGCSDADVGSEAMDTAALDNQQRQQHQESSSPQASAAAAAAAAGDNADTATAASALRQTCTAARQQLEFYMDHFIRMSMLTQFHNPLVVWTLAASNLVTRQPAAAPPQHWLMVRTAQAAEARISCFSCGCITQAASCNCLCSSPVRTQHSTQHVAAEAPVDRRCSFLLHIVHVAHRTCCTSYMLHRMCCVLSCSSSFSRQYCCDLCWAVIVCRWLGALR